MYLEHAHFLNSKKLPKHFKVDIDQSANGLINKFKFLLIRFNCNKKS